MKINWTLIWGIILFILIAIASYKLAERELELGKKEVICIKEYGGIVKNMKYCIYIENGTSKSIELNSIQISKSKEKEK